jgi:hypothetical protein
MSHKAGHIIVQALKSVPSLTQEQRAQLDNIESRDQYTLQDKMYLSILTFQVADDQID